MPLNFTPKGKSNPTAPQPAAAPSPRPQIKYGTPPASTARVNALKDKLKAKPTPVQRPVAPRKAGSSARAEQYAGLQQFTQNTAPVPPPPIGMSSARQRETDLSSIAPPPTGLSAAAQAAQVMGTEIHQSEPELSQLDNSVEPSATTEATSTPLSPQFVALAKKEKAIRRAQQEFKAAQDAWKQDQAKYVSKDELLAEPMKVLSELGLTYDRIVELQLDQVSPDPNQELRNEIAALKAELSGVNQKFVDKDKQQYDAALNQIRNDAKLLVDSDPAFETIKATDEMGDTANGSEAVLELIQEIFRTEGHVIPVEEACQLVEEKLVTRQFERYERLSKLQKIKSRLGTPAENPAEATDGEVTPPQQFTTTLTNNGAVQRPLSARDRAIQAFNRTKV